MVEFTLQLIRALCKNLKACLAHWKYIVQQSDSNDRNKAESFLNKWLNEDRLRLLCSLFDVCEIFGKLQWKFQKSQITIMDVPHVTDIALTELKTILDKPKPGTVYIIFHKFNTLKADGKSS